MVYTYQPQKINAGKSLQRIRQRGTVKKQIIKLQTKVDRNGDLGRVTIFSLCKRRTGS